MLQELLLAIEMYMSKGGSFVTTINGQRKIVSVVEDGPATGKLGGMTLLEAFQLAGAIISGANMSKEFRVGADQFMVTISDEAQAAPPAS